MSRFWVYVGDKVQGPVDIPSLRKVTGFNLLTQVCEEGEQTWRMADEVIEIKSYFLSPPRPNSFALDAGNAAPRLDLTPKPTPEEMILPEPNTSWQKANLEVIPADGLRKDAAGPPALRSLCEVCGYKNPRDVQVCMKCGEKLKGNVAPVSSSPSASVGDPKLMDLPAGRQVPAVTGMTKAPAPASTPAPSTVATPVEPISNTMVEITMSKLLIGAAIAALLGGGTFFGVRSWKKHHTPKTLPAIGTPAPPKKMVPDTISSRRYSSRSVRHSVGYAAALPGVSKKAARAAEYNTPKPKTEEATYRVVAEATPLQKRYSSPINSPYAVKRRANKGLWMSQEDHAIQQVQRTRIYGGQRTIDRNVEILMQILRDREYNTAFESGKRINLYNDLDWSAALKDGPLYEVHLTFSGGREADGSPKKPLHFAFAADLERGTVEPGGEDQIRSNTLHAFFDESRIPPEDRRAIAKDTEELVLAAQPGASPLALDTVVRQFAKVYTTAALSRVADAYDLTPVKKKLAHDTRLGSDEDIRPAVSNLTPPHPTPLPSGEGATKPGEAKPVQPFMVSKGGAADFRMEPGSGRERTFFVRATSRASMNKIWEILTGYDRLKQFMPDMLSSEREGQDGAAVIVHTVCLTRYMVFMFKVNLHFRVVEHPAEHTLEFERIAGDYESFRGSVSITPDPATKESLIDFRATVVPTGHVMNMKLESMARRILIPQMEALRNKAESN